MVFGINKSCPKEGFAAFTFTRMLPRLNKMQTYRCRKGPLASNYPEKSMRIGSTFYFCGLLKKVAACSIFAFCVGSARFNGGQISFGDNKLLLSAVLCTILGTTSCYLALNSMSSALHQLCARCNCVFSAFLREVCRRVYNI